MLKKREGERGKERERARERERASEREPSSYSTDRNEQGHRVFPSVNASPVKTGNLTPNLQPSSPNPQPSTINPRPSTLGPRPHTPHLKPSTPNAQVIRDPLYTGANQEDPESSTLNHQLRTQNSEPWNLKTKPQPRSQIVGQQTTNAQPWTGDQRPSSSFLLLYYSRSLSSVIQTSLSLQYEPSSEPLHNSAKSLFLNREPFRTRHR